MMKKFRLLAGTVALLATILVGLGTSQAQGSTAKTVKIGITGSDHREWDPAVKALKKEGIKVKFVEFSDYNQPNTALANKDIDLNAFQHQYFLDNWNKAHKTNLTPIGKTFIAPLKLYANKHTKLNQFKKGDKVVIPNDSTNEARALELLQSAGLIKIKDVSLPTPKDITHNKLHLKIKAVDAQQTAHSLGDVAGAVINNNVATDAKLPNKKGIYTEKMTKKSNRWINLIVARKSDKNNGTYKKVVKAFQSQATKDQIKKIHGDGELPAWDLKLD